MDFSLLESSPPFFAAVCGIVGLMMGSFLNVVISRLPRMMEYGWKDQCAELEGREIEKRPEFNLIVPRSRCDSCNHPISPYDNIPVLSYLLLKGQCRYCKAAIPSRTAFIEALSGLMSGYAAWHFGFGMGSFGALILVWAMIALAFIDIDTQLLPDSITYP
ncbi:MAG TPA: prepilin peptidase, partial [Burkholderiales bacterium]|nr:prepilin peptidase [Burkholderiales bacterium]